jgi:hypothetical protein
MILREEHRMREFTNKVVRKIFGPKWGRSDGRVEKNV